MSADWPRVRLGDVLTLQRRWLTPELDRQYVEIGVRSFGRGIFHKAPVTGADLGNKRVLRIEPGDLVLMNVFAWEGAVAVAGPAEAGTIGSHRYATYNPNPQQCSAEFLNLFFKTQTGLELLGRVSPGSAGRNRTLNLAQFAEQMVPLPPLGEQERIVERMDAITAKLQQARQLRHETSKESEGLRDSFLRRILGEHDEWATVGDLVGRASFKNGKSLATDGSPSPVRGLSIASMRNGLIDVSKGRFVPLTLDQAQPFLVRTGDVFIVRGNGSKTLVGRAGVAGEVSEPTVFPDLFIRVPPPPDRIDPRFFAQVWNSPVVRTVLEDLAKTTSGLWKVNQGHIASIRIPIPSMSEQQRILERQAAFQQRARSLVTLQGETIKQLDALLATMLDRVLKGQTSWGV